MIELPDDVVQIAARALANSVIGTEDANWTPSDETTKHALTVLEAFLGACQAREQFRVNGTVPNSSSHVTLVESSLEGAKIVSGFMENARITRVVTITLFEEGVS